MKKGMIKTTYKTISADTADYLSNYLSNLPNCNRLGQCKSKLEK